MSFALQARSAFAAMAPPFAPGRRCRSIEIGVSGGSPSPRSAGQYRGDLHESARSSRPPAIQPDRCDRTVAFSWSAAIALFGLPMAPITWSELGTQTECRKYGEVWKGAIRVRRRLLD